MREHESQENAVRQRDDGKLLQLAQQELTHHEWFIDRGEARSKAFEYIEVFYNRQRLHGGLD